MGKWAFIYTLDEPGAPARLDTLDTLICVGVPAVSDAPAVARRLLAEGVELIELCGGFAGAGLAEVLAAVENRVPVGAVFFGVESAAALGRLLPVHPRDPPVE